MLMLRKPPPILFFLMLVSWGCKKEKDTSGPSIEILSPVAGTSIIVPDTLAVSLHVSDDHVVRNVWISLADDNGVPIAPTIHVNVDAASAHIERALIISNENITSGNYSLAVRASDGTNSNSAFRSMMVLGAPLRLRSIFAIPENGGNILRIDSLGTVSTYLNVPWITNATVNSFSQELFVVGGDFDPLRIIHINEGTETHVQNSNAGSGPFFTNIHTDERDQRTYVSSRDGQIRAYRGGNSPVFNASSPLDQVPFAAGKIGERLVSEQLIPGLQQRELVNFTYANGILLNELQCDLDVIAINEISPMEALLFGDRDGAGIIQTRNVEAGGGSDLREFAEGPIHAVARISDDLFALTLPTRVIRYDRSSNSAITIYNGATADLAFDEANGTLLIAAGQQILVIDPFTASISTIIDLPITVKKVLPLFNR